ncbi:MAG TPA: hypothetical protein VKV28_07045 [Candidatus Binataceae bacterium]|nr:hypothetical protein [Candidatus Binataceae bacterium]
MSAKLLDGRWFRVLTVIDQFARECLALVADSALNTHRVALALSQVGRRARSAGTDHRGQRERIREQGDGRVELPVRGTPRVHPSRKADRQERTARPAKQVLAGAVQSADSSVAESEQLFVPPPLNVKGGPEKLPADSTEQAAEKTNLLETVNGVC